MQKLVLFQADYCPQLFILPKAGFHNLKTYYLTDHLEFFHRTHKKTLNKQKSQPPKKTKPKHYNPKSKNPKT